MDSIQGDTECAKQASLARFMHKIGSEMLHNCVSTDFGCEKSSLVILTGIQINMSDLHAIRIFHYEERRYKRRSF